MFLVQCSDVGVLGEKILAILIGFDHFEIPLDFYLQTCFFCRLVYSFFQIFSLILQTCMIFTFADLFICSHVFEEQGCAPIILLVELYLVPKKVALSKQPIHQKRC